MWGERYGKCGVSDMASRISEIWQLWGRRHGKYEVGDVANVATLRFHSLMSPFASVPMMGALAVSMTCLRSMAKWLSSEL